MIEGTNASLEGLSGLAWYTGGTLLAPMARTPTWAEPQGGCAQHTCLVSTLFSGPRVTLLFMGYRTGKGGWGSASVGSGSTMRARGPD